ncbi:OmpL47-type beta-barrel domain-containing protein [Paenibacillus sp. Soil787]|uniref:OmpL47-type beta-barrel domain-containing protein n=1 Tax=Paenibacillus sp. Soil787 TaxID=1736411 RepID=UPI0009E69D5C|nr:LamG-like jellyroll fold domain-containing protein [Paenibacillus sp. Soil787]
MKNKGKKWLSLLTSIVMMAQLCLITLPSTVKAETTSIFTDYLPTITQVTDEAGFTHPGVGLTKDLLENVRTKVRAGAQPWTYYFNSMLLDSPDASKTITSKNSSDGITPSADYFNSQGIEGRFIADGIKAYTQAFMYYMTGDEVYRANAMMIIRIWGKMDPTKYAYYTDAHIHAGVPLNRMVMAAEILRYTSYQTASLAWTDQDTTNFTNNLIVPVTETLLHDQNHFMNQHNYPLLGAMAGYIFTGNRDRYNESVEWFTVNRTAQDQGLNGSVKALFRLVTEEEKPGIHVGEGTPIDEPHVQQMEMGRDQAHGGGDLTNSAMITRLIHAQGTKVDPVAGTPSTADNAVDVMEFLDNRILGAADYFWHFMLGYDTVWTPQAYAITGGDPDNVGMGGYIRDTYNSLSDGYKGRFLTANFWDFYSYYTYVKHEDVSKIAPYYYEAFTKKLPATSGGWGNVDAGNDFWLYLSPEAEADAAKFIPQNKSAGTIYELADRYTNLTKLDNSKPAVKDNDNKNAIKDTNNIDTSAVTTMTEGDNSFIRFFAKEEGTRIAYLSSGISTATYELRIRTNGVATLNTMGKSVSLPDTKGEWKYFPVSGAPFDFDVITVSGASGIIVDIDHINTANLTPSTFKTGNADMKVYTYVGASVNLDFSATDSSSADVITYGLQNNPAGSAIDSGTGAFSWQPTAGGNISLVVTATDGTTITTKNVNIIVGSDRAAAVQAVTAAYNADAIYEKASLANYQTEYNNTMNMISTASDVDFDKQLQALGTATEGLRLLTPLTPLGSMYWSQVASWSSWGKDATGLDDASWGGGWYGLALGTPPHLYHLIDFGPDYKISAYRFGFKASIFADRIANSTVYASNDKINWTRITPGVSAYTQAYNTIDVAPEFQNEKYRYIKLEMVQPLPDVLFGIVRNLFEPRGFTIYGTRYDVGNKLQSVSLSSDQSMLNRIALGSTVKASITATEAIQNVKVKIQGQDATVSTQDNMNWTAVAILTGKDQTGDVKVRVDYQRQDGTNGDTLYGTTDNSKLNVVDDSDLINNVTGITNLIDSTSGRSAATTLQIVNSLFDNNASTSSDFRNGGSGSGWGSYITFDFKEGNKATLSSVELLARQDNYYTRIGGAVVQGSNDNATWTTLTKPAASTTAWQTFVVSDTTAYRYIRIFNGGNWVGNMAEVRFHGNVIVTLTPLPPSDYTKGSYYLYQQEFSRIKAAFNLPGADRVLLAAQLKTAEGSLVRIPLSLYSFEGNANNSFGSSPGTVNGTPVYSAGKVGQAISLNGTNSYVQLPQAHPLSTYDAITVSAWVYWNGSSQWQRIFDFGNNTNQYMFLSPKSGSNTLRFAIKNGGSEQIVETSQLAAGQWAHVAVTLGGGTAKLYVNGELKATKSGFTIKPSDIKPNLNYIGKSQFSDPLFNGMIDEFRVDNSVLSADDIKAVYNNTSKWIDKSLLTLLLVKAAAIDATLYTAETVATLQAIVPTAQSVLANANATQAQIDTVSASLQAALDGLQYPVTVTLNPAAPNGLKGWYTVPVTVTLSTYGKAEYSLDGGTTWQPYTSAITFDKEGKYTVSYRSTDNAGNLEMAKSVDINLDSTAPVTTAVVTPAQPDGQHGWYVHPVTVTLSTYDNLSDVGKTEISLDGGSTWLAYTAPVTFNQDSKYTVSYRSTDNAGNVEAVKTIGFNLDATAPTITVSGLVYGTYSDSMDITPILTLSDKMSGVDSSKTTVTVSTYGEQQTVQQGATIPLYTLPLGSHAFIVTASDLAGNTSSQTVIFQTSTSIQSLQALITRFTNMGWIDRSGIANSLQNILAANDLADFIGEVQAQSGKHISAQAAGFLLRDAQYMLSKQ